MEGICTDKEQQIREKREQLKILVATVSGADNPELLTIRQRSLLEELTVYRGEMARNAAEIGRAKGELAAQAGTPPKRRTIPTVPAVEVDLLVQNDPVARQLSTELGWKTIEDTQNQQAVKQGTKNPYTDQSAPASVHAPTEVRRAAKELESKASGEASQHGQHGNCPAASVADALGGAADRDGKEDRQVAGRYAELRHHERRYPDGPGGLRSMEQVAATFVNEREKLRAEIKATPRIFALGTGRKAPDSVQYDVANRADVLGGPGELVPPRVDRGRFGTAAAAASTRRTTCRRGSGCP